MFALFIDSDLFMFSVKIDELSPMTIKSQVHSFSKVCLRRWLLISLTICTPGVSGLPTAWAAVVRPAPW